MKSLAERMADLAAEIAPKRARMAAIQKGADEDGERDLNVSEAEEFEDIADEVKGLETKLRRLKALDESAETARPVRGSDPADGSRARDTVAAQPRVPLEKGVGFARMVMCFAAARGNRFEAVEIAKQRYPHEKALPLLLKAPTAGGTTLDPEFAAPLVDPTNLVSEFIEYLRPLTVVGRIPGLRRVPFNVRITGQNVGGGAGWVGEGKGKPVTRFGYEAVILRWTKVAAISVLSEDLIRFSAPSAELLVRNSLAEVIVERMDTDFVNPSVSGVTDVQPASVFNGASTSAASGIDAGAVRADIKTAATYFITNNIPTSTLVIVMRHSQALSLSLMRNALGVKEFPDMTMNGGFLEGIPVVASQYMPQGIVGFVSADNVYLADDGGVTIDMSREASLQMDSAPTMSMGDPIGSPYVATATSVVSMFQTNSVAIRAERFVNWKKRRSTAAYYFTATGWGNDDTSPPQAAI